MTSIFESHVAHNTAVRNGGNSMYEQNRSRSKEIMATEIRLYFRGLFFFCFFFCFFFFFDTAQYAKD